MNNHAKFWVGLVLLAVITLAFAGWSMAHGHGAIASFWPSWIAPIAWAIFTGIRGWTPW